MLVDKQTGEIFLYAPIGDMFIDGITGEEMLLALGAMDGKRVTVRINSPGGSADEGIAIYGALRRYEGGVDTVVDSIAASAASLIALAGENRTTARGARWMIHRAMGFAGGNRDELMQLVNVLDKYDESQVEIYSNHFADATAEEIKAMMVAETWFSGDEAVTAGLSTGREDVDAQQPNVAAWFHNAPAAVLATKAATAELKKVPVMRNAAAILARNK